MEFQPLNKFEKENRVIELHLAGKTIREIAPEVHMSFRDISKIMKAYDKKILLQQNKKEGQENNQPTTKKVSLSSRVFKLFSDGKSSTEVVIELDIQPEKVEKLWSQFLKSERMGECYDFFQVCQYDIPTFLSINNFIKRNNAYGKDIANVLKKAKDVIKLNQTYLHLKTEINNLEHKRMFLLDYSRSPYSLHPLPLNKPHYNYYHY